LNQAKSLKVMDKLSDGQKHIDKRAED